MADGNLQLNTPIRQISKVQWKEIARAIKTELPNTRHWSAWTKTIRNIARPVKLAEIFGEDGEGQTVGSVTENSEGAEKATSAAWAAALKAKILGAEANRQAPPPFKMS